MCEKIRVYLEDTLIQLISPGDLLVYAPNIIKVSYNCNEKGIKEIKNNTLIRLEKHCNIQINDQKFSYQDEIIKGEIFHLPNINIKTNNVEDIKPIKLSKINLESYEKIQAEIATAKIPHLESINQNHTNRKIICKNKLDKNLGNTTQALAEERQDPF
ncbi:hypothetical protein QE152_g6752 [Popillia japonica]|uniref:Uncharacterized protein n=1 Tax=Popillia japonica TaxID=7064 RepID=A0AAW1MGZ7_POPJA